MQFHAGPHLAMLAINARLQQTHQSEEEKQRDRENWIRESIRNRVGYLLEAHKFFVAGIAMQMRVEQQLGSKEYLVEITDLLLGIITFHKGIA